MIRSLNVRRVRQIFNIRPRQRLQLATTAATIFFVGLVASILLVATLFIWYSKDLPTPDKVNRTSGLSTVIVDRNGESLYDIYTDQNRIPVTWDNIPVFLREATIAVEDKDFYKHQGLSQTGIVRGMIACIILRRCQGGSTLTQQLVKNVLLTQERTLPRKMKEAILAIQIERKYTKDEILRMYFNETPYGGTAVGVESASQYYFDKRAKDLTLTESIILSGIPQAPSLYSPFLSDAKAYVARAEHVAHRMFEDGYITAAQELAVKKELPNVQFSTGDSTLRAPHFVAYVKDLLEKKFGSKLVDAGGLRVTTSLDWKLQDKAQQIVKEEVDKAKKLKVGNGSAVVLDPTTGEILAMVGSKDYNATDSGGFKYNVATQGLRQPGSAIKPITYATAFKKGYTASTLLMDVDTKYPIGEKDKPDYNPKNYDLKYRGPMQLRYALANSINTIAVKVTALVGIKDILRTSYDMGLSTLEPTDENIKRLGLSLTLGGGEVTLLDLTSAFGVLADSGMRQDPIAILKVEDAKGTVLFEQKPTSPRRVLNADVAYIVTSILSDNAARKEVFGDRSYLYIAGRDDIFVKTGTTDDKRDNWTVGGSPTRVVGVWVGNNDNSPMNQALASGVTGAAPIWNRLIREAIKDVKDKPFERPDSIVEVEIDSFGGGLPIAGQSTRKELFIKGTEPTGPASIYKSIKVSKRDSNKLANAVEIARNEYDTKQFIVLFEKDPVSTDGKNRWQEGIDDWISKQSDAKYHPPTDTYQGNDQIGVSIKEPGDHDRIDNNDVHIRIEVGTNNDVSKVEIQVDGSVVKTVSGKSISETITVPNGIHTISARAVDNKGNSAQADVHVGINTDYAAPTPTPTPKPTDTPTPTP